MRLLAWDTSAKTGTLAAVEWEPGGTPNVLSDWQLDVKATHSEKLLWAIHQILESVQWKLGDIDAFGVGVGPGSFTGLRIGLTTARTIAHLCEKPLIPISSLVALARPAAEVLIENLAKKSRVLVIGAVDACKGEIFGLVGAARAIQDCVVPQVSGGAAWKRGVEQVVLPPGEFLKLIKKKLREGGAQTKWSAVGNAWERYPELYKGLPASRRLGVPSSLTSRIQGRALGTLAWQGFQAGIAQPAISVYPSYMRASSAEIKLKTGLL